MKREKFWSDDFDMDLLKVFPWIEKALGATVHETVWTVGHTSFGRLNHPTVWNTHGAYLWLKKPELLRDERGWFNLIGCVDNSELVECTWLEWMRDWWPHGYAFVALTDVPFQQSQAFPAAPRRVFDDLMFSVRGWRPWDQESVDRATLAALRRIVTCNLIFARLVEAERLASGEIAPYFAADSVPGYNGPAFRPRRLKPPSVAAILRSAEEKKR